MRKVTIIAVFIFTLVVAVAYFVTSRPDMITPDTVEPFNLTTGMPILVSDADLGGALTSKSERDAFMIFGEVRHVVWTGIEGKGVSNVYYKRSLDDGMTWEDPVGLTDEGAAEEVSLMVQGNNVYVVWKDSRDNDNNEIYFKYSHDEGETWSEDMRITDDDYKTAAPYVTAHGETVYLTWETYNPMCQIHFRKSMDGGATWGKVKNLTGDIEVGSTGITRAEDGTLHFVYGSQQDGDATKHYNWEAYYMQSTDDGMTWSKEVRLTDDGHSDTRFPVATTSGDSVHVVWWDDLDDTIYEHYGYPPIKPESDHNYDVYYLRSLDGGQTWDDTVRLTFSDGPTMHPSIEADGDRLYVVYQDSQTGDDEVYLKYSLDLGETWSDEVLISKDDGVISHVPSFVLDEEGDLFIIWTDGKDVSGEVYVKEIEV